MAEALRELIDRQSGKVPNLGPNDGAHLLRLSACPFEDFRPVVQASHVILKRERLLAPGPWDEALFWLGAEDGTAKTSPTAGAASTQPRQALPDYGIHFLRGEQSWAALRCVRFRSRPGHSDQLHLDLWWRGVNVALDAGSYLYNGQPPWDHGLAAADVHNTILVDGREPMLRAGPFLWLGRDRGRVLGHWRTESGGVEVVAGEHRAGAPRHIRHRRTVLRCGDRVWCVADDIIGRGDHDLRLSWLIPDGHWTAVDGGMQVELGDLRWAVEVQAEEPILALYRAGTRIWGPAIGGESPVWGWHSPTYSVRVPALHLKVLVRKELPQRLITVWTLGGGPREVPKIGWRAVGQAPVAFEWVEFGGERLRV
jgi:asparagine synthase (glutamine-hydrolysing)